MDLSFYTSLNVEVPTYSQSDDLFVTFTQKHDTLPLDAIDDLIALLRMREFDSSQITFDNTLDMMRYIAEHSRINALQRASKKTYPRLPVPPLVVDLVADHLAQESMSMMSSGFTDCPNRATLHKMALVHRSWTNTAQRILHQRIVISGIENLRNMPLFGPRVRELSFRLLPKIDIETASCLVCVRHACPNIHNLRLDIPNASKCPAFNEFIKELLNFSSLRRLRLDTFGECSPDLRFFFQMLPKMTTLKSLALALSSDKLLVSEQMPGDETQQYSPALTLLSYTVYWSVDGIERSLPYIFRSGSGLTRLELNFLDFLKFIKSPVALQAVYSVLSEITDLRFHVSPISAQKGSFDILTKCVKLLQLTIVAHGGVSAAPVQTIPDTLEHLWIHYDYLGHPDYVPYQGECILKTIKRLPNLKTLTITVIEAVETLDDPFVFEEAHVYCLEKGIELTMKFGADHLPPFEEQRIIFP